MAQINILDYNKIVYFDENTGNYKIFDGERWWLSDDKFGTSTKPSGVALVDSAIVDKSVVGEEERPPMQTIWEGTFNATYSEDVGKNMYTTQDIQNGELLKNCNEVTVTLDGTTYVLPVEQSPIGYVVEATDFGFAFFAESPSSTVIVGLMIFTQTEGEHTIKVEGAPSGDEPSGDTLRVLYDGEVTGGTVQGDFIYKNALFSELSSMADYTQATITVNGESKTILPVNEVQGSYSHTNYILGMDAYPPTELSSYGVGVAVVYEAGKQTGSYVPYIITLNGRGTPVTSLKVEVDENDKGGK